MKFSKLSFAAVGILLGTSGLVVSCGGGDAVTRDSKPQTATLSESTHDGSEPCDPRMTEILDNGDEGAASSQPPLSKPRQNSGSGDAQTHQVDAGCILPELK